MLTKRIKGRADRRTDRQTDRQGDGQTGRQTFYSIADKPIKHFRTALLQNVYSFSPPLRPLCTLHKYVIKTTKRKKNEKTRKTDAEAKREREREREREKNNDRETTRFFN